MLTAGASHWRNVATMYLKWAGCAVLVNIHLNSSAELGTASGSEGKHLPVLPERQRGEESFLAAGTSPGLQLRLLPAGAPASLSLLSAE